MSDYKPRAGDTIKVELTVMSTASVAGLAIEGEIVLRREQFAHLLTEGKVELVSRAEPDWQPGEIGQHIETGELFQYRPEDFKDVRPWWSMALSVNRTPWRSRDEMAGKLVRCKVVPEEE